MTLHEGGGALSGALVLSTATVVCVRPNPFRKKLELWNTDGAETVYVTLGDVAFSTFGAYMPPGSYYSIERDTRGYIWKGAISAIAVANTPRLTWVEQF